MTTAMFIIIGYIWTRNEGEDYFSPLRKSLSGKWALTYQEWDYNDSGGIKEDSRNENATFGIDKLTKKLFVIITVTNHPIFGSATQRVDGVAITSKAGVKQLYYYDNFILSKGNNSFHGVSFVLVTIKENQQGNPEELLGTWYDLNGEFAAYRAADFEEAHGHKPAEGIPQKGEIRFYQTNGNQRISA
jgi:hypothetical protein